MARREDRKRRAGIVIVESEGREREEGGMHNECGGEMTARRSTSSSDSCHIRESRGDDSRRT